MSFQKFVQKMQDRVQSALGEEIIVKTVSVRKMNGIDLQGLSLKKKDGRIAPTIYLESFYEQYEAGTPFSELLRKFVDTYRENEAASMPDLEFMQNYALVRETLGLKLINLERNREFLKEIAFVPYLNLAIIFYCRLEDTSIGSGTITVKKAYLGKWEVTVEQLFEDALQNAQRTLPCRIFTMEQVLAGREKWEPQAAEEIPTIERQLNRILEQSEEQELFAHPQQNDEQEEHLPMMIIAANASQYCGASVLLYQGFLQSCAKAVHRNLYILPSSIHEVLLLPDEGQEPEKLLEMVQEVNQTQVEPEEWLADAVYYYDAAQEQLQLARG